jgi:cytochrome P450 family 135
MLRGSGRSAQSRELSGTEGNVAVAETITAAQAGKLPPGPAMARQLQTPLFWWKVDWFLRSCERRYGSIFTLRILPWRDVVVVSDPQAIKTIFTGDPDVWRAGESYELLAPLIGRQSLVLLDGPEHLDVRRRLLPPFHGKIIGQYEQLIEEIAAAEVASWPIGEPIELVERMRAITLEVMMRAVIGAEESHQRAELRRALAAAVQLKAVMLLMWVWPALKHVGPWRAFNLRLANARQLLRDEISQRRADPSVHERSDVLSSLISANELHDGELLDQLATLLLAGHDTSTVALAWAFERLLRHPEALARAQDDEDYLDAVIKETLRLRPVLPGVTRQTARPVELAGHHIPAGVTVLPCIRLVQLSKSAYPDPECFRPERFLNGEGQGYTWIPFGGGTRRCIGAAFASFQMRVVMRTILAHAELQADPAGDEPIRNEHITLVPGRGGRVIKRRSR